jgi:hypothetical protein
MLANTTRCRISSKYMFTAGGTMKKLVLVILLTAAVAQAEMYRWTDTGGTVHFSDSIGEVPANYRKIAKPLGMETSESTTKNKAVPSVAPRQRAVDNGSAAPDLEGLKERMLKDEGTMTLIRELQNDPEMQALLSDPAILRAIQAGDYATLISNPDFMKLLNNPRVREIGNGMNNSKTR